MAGMVQKEHLVRIEEK